MDGQEPAGQHGSQGQVQCVSNAAEGMAACRDLPAERLCAACCCGQAGCLASPLRLGVTVEWVLGANCGAHALQSVPAKGLHAQEVCATNWADAGSPTHVCSCMVIAVL